MSNYDILVISAIVEGHWYCQEGLIVCDRSVKFNVGQIDIWLIVSIWQRFNGVVTDVARYEIRAYCNPLIVFICQAMVDSHRWVN